MSRLSAEERNMLRGDTRAGLLPAHADHCDTIGGPLREPCVPLQVDQCGCKGHAGWDSKTQSCRAGYKTDATEKQGCWEHHWRQEQRQTSSADAKHRHMQSADRHMRSAGISNDQVPRACSAAR